MQTSDIPSNTKIGVNILPEAVIVTATLAHLVLHVYLRIWTVHVPTNSKVLCLSKVNGICD